MRIEHLRAPLVLALLAAACHHGARGDGTPASGRGPSLCAKLDAENAAALDALSTGTPSDAETTALKGRLRAAATCTPTAGGGWGIRLTGLQNRDGGIWGRWSIVHGSAASAGVAPDTGEGGFAGGGAEPTATANNLQWTTNRRIFPTPPALYDFDGDGEPEAVAIVEATDVAESGLTATVHRGRVWRGSGTTVELFAPARDLTVEELRDTDRDGRPDIITRGSYTGFATLKCGSEESYPVLGPPLLAHSLAGGRFDLTDAAAVAFATSSCGSTTGAVMATERKGGAGVDFARSAHNIACARLRGTPTASLLARVAEACTPSADAACPPCDDRSLLERWASLQPPLRLK